MGTKTKSAHTPGPWEVCSSMVGDRRIYGVRNAVNGADNPYPGHLVSDRSIPVAERGAIGFSWRTDNEADARLIAAAPALLKALRGVQHHNDATRAECRLPKSLAQEIQDAIALTR